MSAIEIKDFNASTWSPARTVEAPAWLANWVFESARRRHDERRAAAGLLSMGDRLLRDIGMTRADAEALFD